VGETANDGRIGRAPIRAANQKGIVWSGADMGCVPPWPGDARGSPVCLLPIARLPALSHLSWGAPG